MFKTITIALLVLFVALLVLPVLVAQFRHQPQRHLVGASLDSLDYQEVSFRNEAQDLGLAGMLFIPEGEGPFPAVVMIHGSGTSSRDNPWYLNFVAYMQAHGIAVLLPDKRGSVNSGGDWHSASFEDLATDTLAALDFMRSQEIVPVSTLGIWGGSQGGQFTPLVASLDPQLDFLVDSVGTSLPLFDAFHYEETQNLEMMGFLPGFSNLIAYASTYYIRKVAQPDFWDAVGNFDPLPYWQQLEIPALVQYGQTDTNVPAERSAARLNALGKDNIRVQIYAGSGHPLEDPVGTGDQYFREDALADIAELIFSANP